MKPAISGAQSPYPAGNTPRLACSAMAACYVPLYDSLCEIVSAIKDDPEASREMKALARRGRKTLDEAKARVANTNAQPTAGTQHGKHSL